jgi:hypothetical protein
MPAETTDKSGIITTYTILIVLVGVVIRLGYYSLDRSLWQDEAMLAYNLINRSYSDLLKPLEYNQHAPPLFLLAERLIVSYLGHGEKVLRLQSLIAGIVSVLLFGSLARRLLNGRTALVATMLFALSPPLIRYSAEVKPYSGDVLCAVILVLAGSVSDPRRTFSAGSFVPLFVAGMIAILYSFTSAFVLAGLGLYLFCRAWSLRNHQACWAIVAASACWLSCFLACMWFLGRHSLGNRELMAFWDHTFLPLPPKSLYEARSAVLLVAEMLRWPIGFDGWQLPALLMLIGLVRSQGGADHVRLTTLAVLSVLLAVSTAKLYPLSGRLTLFTAPFICLIIGLGADHAIATERNRGLVFAATCLLLALSLLFLLRDQFTGDDQKGFGTRQALEAAFHECGMNERVYVYHEIFPVFEFYARLGILPESHVIRGINGVMDWQEYRRQIQDLHGPVCFVFGDVKRFRVDERELILFELDRRGDQLAEKKIGNSYLYKYYFE